MSTNHENTPIKHTPGPWTIDLDEGEIINSNDEIVGLAYHPRDLGIMAAAPALLASLKELLAWINDPNAPVDAWAALSAGAYAAIAKAEGKE